MFKHLLHKRENQSSDPSTHINAGWEGQHTCDSRAQKMNAGNPQSKLARLGVI